MCTVCVNEKDKENGGANASSTTVRFAAGEEWSPHVDKHTVRKVLTSRLSHTEIPSSVDSFDMLRLVRKAPGYNHYFIFFAQDSGMWALLCKVTQGKEEVEMCWEPAVEDQVLQRIGVEELEELCKRTFPQWIKEKNTKQKNERKAKNQADARERRSDQAKDAERERLKQKCPSTAARSLRSSCTLAGWRRCRAASSNAAWMP